MKKYIEEYYSAIDLACDVACDLESGLFDTADYWLDMDSDEYVPDERLYPECNKFFHQTDQNATRLV